MTPSVLRRWRYEAMLLFVVTVWGVNFVVLKAALTVLHPHVINALRCLVAAGTLGAIYVHRQRADGQALLAPWRGHAVRILLLGLLGYAGYLFCFIEGIARTKAGSAALIMASAPLWTAALAGLFRLERLMRAAWVALALTFSGTALIVLAGPKEIDFSNDVFAGNAIMVLAALLWGSYTALSRPTLQRISPIGLTFWNLVVALPFLVGVALPHVGGIAWTEVTGWVWLAILFSGGLSIGVTIFFWNTAVQAVGSSQTAAFNNLVPFIALISGAVFLGEAITLVQVLGGVLIVSGLLLMRRTRGRTPRS